MEQNALGGSYLGLLGHVAGAQASDDLLWTEKGKLGKFMAKRTSNILGDLIKFGGAEKNVKVSGGNTRADYITAPGPVEAKFGYSATLSKRQKEAFNQLPNYHVYHFLPDDVGRITGGLLALANAQAKSRPGP